MRAPAAGAPKPNGRRQYKNKKYGFGGKKNKSNDRESYLSGTFSIAKNKAPFPGSKSPASAGKGKKKKNTRPGKNKRRQMKGN